MNKNVKKNRKVILRQGQSPGDILTFTRCVADLKRAYPDWSIDVRTPCMEIFENNPNITHLDDNDKDVEIFDISYDEINNCGWVQEHWTKAYHHDVEKKLGVKFEQTSILPELWIGDIEKTWINQVECEFGWKGPFWVGNFGMKQDNELKKYHRWQEVVDIFNERFKGKVKMVSVGHKDHIHPKLNGVLDLVGKTDIRQLIRLIYNAHGTVGPLSFQFVISAALKQPSVCVAGGKEDVRWHLYPHIKHIYSNGSLPCCEWGGCWLGGKLGECRNMLNGVPRCFAIIEPYMIVDAIESYYKGGKLSF